MSPGTRRSRTRAAREGAREIAYRARGAAGTYGAQDFILVHELGHRYERKRQLPKDFDQPGWKTTRYSSTEGEAFPELFALGHFGITGAWDPEVQERFEKLMGAG